MSTSPIAEEISPSPFSGGGAAFKTPFQVFLVPWPSAVRYSAYLVTFPNYSLCTFQEEKMSGQIRSGHQSEFVDPASERTHLLSILISLTRGPLGGFEETPLVFPSYFLNRHIYQHKTFSTIWDINFTPSVRTHANFVYLP